MKPAPDHIVNGELIEVAPIIEHRKELTRRSLKEMEKDNGNPRKP